MSALKIEQLRNELGEVVSSFEKASGLHLAVHHYATRLLDPPDNPVPLKLLLHRTPFCEQVKKTADHECIRCDAEEVPKLCQKMHEPFVHRCHAGADEIIVPLHRSGVLVGVAFVGQFRTSASQPKRLRRRSGKQVGEVTSLCRTMQSYLVELDAKLEYQKRLGSSDRERRLLEFIDQRLLDNPSVSDVSAHLRLSKSRTSHFIKELTGRSLRELKEQRRLRRARDLLAATALSVKEVAVQCGFNDENYFCRYFRLKAGSSPLAFRRQTRSRQSP